MIDADYRGEVMVAIRMDGSRRDWFEAGTSIAQAKLVPAPRVNFTWADELPETARGTGGFGHSDKKAAP